ncbi:TPA: hypothetical protein ACQDQH_002745 [Legionella pneumophila]
MKSKVIVGIISAVLGSQSSFATHLNHYALDRQIVDISYQLNQIAENNSTDLCSGDVLIAAAYLKSAGGELQHHQKDKALVSMAYGHNELKEISTVRSYCVYLSHKVKPYLAKVLVLQSELERISLPDANEPQD